MAELDINGMFQKLSTNSTTKSRPKPVNKINLKQKDPNAKPVAKQGK